MITDFVIYFYLNFSIRFFLNDGRRVSVIKISSFHDEKVRHIRRDGNDFALERF